MRGFRDFLYEPGISPRSIPRRSAAKGAEGGANVFKLDYFHRPAVLAQSPQFYKQMMVGVFDRVFETAPVFRAEKHNTKRHLNEYTSLDFEMGYINGFEDIMEMETGFLTVHDEAALEREYAEELKILGVTLPKTDTDSDWYVLIRPKSWLQKNTTERSAIHLTWSRRRRSLIGQYFKEEYDADFVFVTHYPSKKRPFYAMDDPEDSDALL